MHIQNDDQIQGDQGIDLVDLTEAERFVVRSIRKWLFGHRFEKQHIHSKNIDKLINKLPLIQKI